MLIPFFSMFFVPFSLFPSNYYFITSHFIWIFCLLIFWGKKVIAIRKDLLGQKAKPCQHRTVT